MMDAIKIFLNLLGLFLELFFSLLFFFLIRVLFDIEIIGQYGIIISFLVTFSFLTSFGISISYLKLFSKTEDSNQKAIYNGTFIFIKFIFFLIYALIIVFLYMIFPIYKVEPEIFLIFFFGFILTIISDDLFQYLLVRNKNIIKKSMLGILSHILKIVFLIVFSLFFNLNLVILSIIILIPNIIYLSIGLIFLKDIKIKKPTRESKLEFFKEIKPLILISMSTVIVQNVDILLVSIWYSLEEVANFYTAKQIFLIIIFLIYSIVFILIQTFSKNLSDDNNEENISLIYKIHKFLNLIIIPLVLLIILYSSEILGYILGEKYAFTGTILSILSLYIIICSLDIGNIIYLRAIGDLKLLAKVVVFENVLVFLFMLVFIPPFFLNLGALGAALAIGLAAFVSYIIKGFIYYQKFHIRFYWGACRNIIIMLAILILQLYINSLGQYPIYLIPLFIIFNLGLYFFINFLLRGFSIDELRDFTKIFSAKNIKDVVRSEFNEIE